MKMKVIASIGLALFLPTQVFAMEIVGGKLLSHKEINTGKIKVTFQDLKVNKQMIPQKSNDLNTQYGDYQDISSSSHALVQEAYREKGDWVHLTGSHELYITNNSSLPVTYAITCSICSYDASGGLDSCATSIDEVELNENGGYLQMNKESDIDTLYRFYPTGIHHEEVTTAVFNETNSDSFKSYDRQPIPTDLPPHASAK